MIGAVLLAAGDAARMGAPKLLLPLDGEPLVRRAAAALCATGCDEVLVVTGAEHEAIGAALDGLDLRCVRNPEHRSGIGSSIRAGLAALDPRCEAALLALADRPFVGTREYRALVDAWRLHQPLVVLSRFGGTTAPPHLVGRELFPELSVQEAGARAVLERQTERRIVLDFPPELLADVDTPEEFERARRRLAPPAGA